jgi:hypothetical protein
MVPRYLVRQIYYQLKLEYFMKTNDICKALYALPGGVVEPRRRPVMKPVVLALIGVVLLILAMVAVEDKSSALSMGLIVVGATLACYGVIVSVVRMSGSERVPYHLPSRGYMRYVERYYEREQLPKLLGALSRSDRAAIDAIPTGNVAAVTLVSYYAADDSLDVYAVYEYVDLERRRVGEVVIVKKD